MQYYMSTIQKIFCMATLCMCAIHLYAATDSHIAGHVLDVATQEHMGYVNVQIKGTSIGSTTDESGH